MNMIKLSVSIKSVVGSVGHPNIVGCLGYIVSWKPEYFGCPTDPTTDFIETLNFIIFI